MLIYSKIKVARKIFDISQKALADATTGYQGDISDLEKGNRAFVPLPILQELQRKGVNMDALIDERIDLSAFRTICVTKKKPAYADCDACKSKDEKIKLLEEHLQTKSVLIDNLQHIIETLKGKK